MVGWSTVYNIKNRLLTKKKMEDLEEISITVRKYIEKSKTDYGWEYKKVYRLYDRKTGKVYKGISLIDVMIKWVNKMENYYLSNATLP